MYEKPNLFKRIIAISPADVWDEGYLQRKNIDYSTTHKQLVERLFISASSDEPDLYRGPIISLQKQIEDNKYKNLSLLNVIIEGERHSGGAVEAYNRGLRWVFKDIAPTGPSGLAKYFGKQN